jgi:hypothetical protein
VFPSPRLGDSVFVLLCDNIPIGTAFAVRCHNQNKMITAGHIIYDYDKGTPIEGKLSVAIQIEKNMLGHIVSIEKNLNVKVLKYSINNDNDWAVLKTQRMNSFTTEDSIPICKLLDIPPSRTEPHFKLYHCPTEQYDIVRVVTMTSSSWMKPQAIKSSGEIYFPSGFSKGSSGGVFVDREGRAVAILESISSAKTLAEAKSSTGSAVSTDEKSLEEAIDSSAHSHSSISRSLIISYFPELMEALLL